MFASIDGHIDGTLFAFITGKWVPLQRDHDDEAKMHSAFGLLSSGQPLCIAGKRLPCFRLECCKGDLTRAFLRYLPPTSPSPAADELEFEAAPFLLFIRDVLCVRALPSWGITPSLAQVRSDSAWERLELVVPKPVDGDVPVLQGGEQYQFLIRSQKCLVCFDAKAGHLVRQDRHSMLPNTT